MLSDFTPSLRAGSGTPLLCLHGFTDTWRTWELILPALERRHDVLAVTLAGHAGGPPIEGEANDAALIAAVEQAMDEADLDTAHILGNSLGGYLAPKLAARGRARSVVALAPAGGWAQGDESYRDTMAYFASMQGTLLQTPRQSWAHPMAGAARLRTSPSTSSTSLPSCWPTKCAAPPTAQGLAR